MTSDETPTIELFGLSMQLSPRREDIDLKQAKIARLLADAQCEAVLLLERPNVRWFTSGAAERGVYHAEECPVLFVNSNQRWVICSSVDTQRLFDEELDGLGFQVKEWPSTMLPEQFLTELCAGRTMATDRSFREFKRVGTYLEQERRRLSRFEQERLRELGSLLVHAIEATARHLQPGDREEEVAGHLAHRLLKRGAEPIALSITAEDRARTYRRTGFTSAQIEKRCLLQATAGKFGLFATASRTVCLGPPDETVKQEFEFASRLQAVWLASTKPGDRPAALYETARPLLRRTPFEHESRLSSPGWWTGRLPSEALFTPGGQERFADRQAVVWQARIGGMAVCETRLVTENAIIPLTAVEDWPFRRYVIQGERFDLPDLLIRNPS
jgi:Xaa-Pro aminopeptidase